MAVTKIHPIKSTLKKALDYITNPAKTEGKLYVSSFGCAVETADIEFEKTRLRAMNKGNNLAHHLIQAFEPGEVTPEAAHEIGRQLADSILGSKYEYVLTTHIDKGHVHNHLIFCAVDFAEHIISFRSLCLAAPDCGQSARFIRTLGIYTKPIFPVRTVEVAGVAILMLGAAVLVPVKSGLSLHEHFKCAAFTAHKVHSGCASFLDLGRKKRRRLLSKSAALRDAKRDAALR